MIGSSLKTVKEMKVGVSVCVCVRVCVCVCSGKNGLVK